MRNYQKIALLGLIACNAMASGLEEQTLSAVVSIRAGWDWAQVGKSQHVQLLRSDPAPDYFNSTQPNNSAFMYGGFLGLEFPLQTSRDLRWQTGVAYYQTLPLETKGTRSFFSQQQFENLAYSYQLKNQRMMFENKFLVGFNDRIYLYLLGGVGVGFNKAYDYDETTLDNTTPPTGVFDSNTTASISYSVGAGFEVVLVSNFVASLGYQFSDLGEVSLGTFSTGNTSDTLNMPNTLTQELVFALGVLF